MHGIVKAQVRRPVTSRAMIVFMISVVPPKTDWTRLSARGEADHVPAAVVVLSVQLYAPVGDAASGSVSYRLTTGSPRWSVAAPMLGDAWSVNSHAGCPA